MALHKLRRTEYAARWILGTSPRMTLGAPFDLQGRPGVRGNGNAASGVGSVAAGIRHRHLRTQRSSSDLFRGSSPPRGRSAVAYAILLAMPPSSPSSIVAVLVLAIVVASAG